MKKIILSAAIVLLLSCIRNMQNKTADEIAVSELINADKEFSACSVREGRNSAFLKYAADEAVMLRPNAYPIEGIDSIKAGMTAGSDSSFTLQWEPFKGFLAGSGELGYTYGTYRLIMKDTVMRGTYITIWKKTGSGWKFVLDAGNEGLGD